MTEDTASKGQPAIEARGLGKQYRNAGEGFWVFRNLDLTVRQGEMVCVSGPSGCGKTTLLSLLAGLDRPTEGQVSLLGNRIDSMSESSAAAVRRRVIGFVFQFFYLLPNLTVLENVALPLMVGARHGSDLTQAAEMVSRLGLANRIRHYPRQLSGGEQQRVALGRALVTNPSIILADEPTGNLDLESAALVLSALRRQTEEGRTVLIVSHNQLVIRLSDREIDLARITRVSKERS
jgi:putative ABC transport system ATP-binding protein